MKRLTVMLLGLFLMSTVYSQNIIDEAFSQYKEKDNYTKVNVTGKMFEMASEIEIDEADENLQDVKELVADIEAFNMILGTEEVDTEQKYFSGLDIIQARYEELMSVDDKEGQFSFYIDEDNGVVYEVVLIGATNDKFMVASLVGQMDLRKLGQITKRIKKEGLSLGSVMSEENHTVKVFPNPSPAGQDMTIKVSSDIVGAQAQLMDLSGRVVHQWTIVGETDVVPGQSLVAGRYVLELTRGERVVRKKLIIQ